MNDYDKLAGLLGPLELERIFRTVGSDKKLYFGSSKNVVTMYRSSALAANTALTGVLEGTPVTPAISAGTWILSNTENNGDILIVASDDGTSNAAIWADASTPLTTIYYPALGGDLAGGNYNLNSIGHIGLASSASSTKAIIVANKIFTAFADNDDYYGIFLNLVQGQKTSAAYTGTMYGTWIRTNIRSTNTQNWSHATLGMIGIAAQTCANSPGTAYTLTGAAGIAILSSAFENNITVTTYYSLYVYANANSAIGTNYGIYVGDQTGGTTADYGVAIAGADTCVLWLGSGADNSDAANGIMFGASKDTNLYRSAANTLKTDDTFSAAAFAAGATAGADFNGAVTNLTVIKGIVTAAS